MESTCCSTSLVTWPPAPWLWARAELAASWRGGAGSRICLLGAWVWGQVTSWVTGWQLSWKENRCTSCTLSRWPGGGGSTLIKGSQNIGYIIFAGCQCFRFQLGWSFYNFFNDVVKRFWVRGDQRWIGWWRNDRGGSSWTGDSRISNQLKWMDQRHLSNRDKETWSVLSQWTTNFSMGTSLLVPLV